MAPPARHHRPRPGRCGVRPPDRGRRPAARRGQAEEVAVDEELAERRGLRVGSRYRVAAFTREQLDPAGEGRAVAPRGAAADLLVAGIVRYPGDLVPRVTDQDNLFVNRGELYLTPAYWQRYGPDIANYGIGLAVALHDGQAGLPRLNASLRRLFGPQAGAESTEGWSGDEAITTGTRRAIALESAALAAFALLAAVAAMLLVGQTLGRQILMEAAEAPVLRALGMTRGQLVGTAVVRAAPLAGAGSVLAVAGAVALSPATPLGVARRAEQDPGLAVDLPVLAAGGGRRGRRGAGVRRPGRLAHRARPGRRARQRGAPGSRTALWGGDGAGRGRPPPAAVIGTRLALEPGRAAPPCPSARPSSPLPARSAP